MENTSWGAKFVTTTVTNSGMETTVKYCISGKVKWFYDQFKDS